MDRKSCTALMAAIIFSGINKKTDGGIELRHNLWRSRDDAEKLWDLIQEDDNLEFSHGDCTCECHGLACN